MRHVPQGRPNLFEAMLVPLEPRARIHRPRQANRRQVQEQRYFRSFLRLAPGVVVKFSRTPEAGVRRFPSKTQV